MKPQRTIYLPATDRTITLATYVKAVKTARANPTITFRHGLNGWWPVTGADVVAEFRRSIHDRINSGIPYTSRGARP